MIIAEIRCGVAFMDAGRKRDELAATFLPTASYRSMKRWRSPGATLMAEEKRFGRGLASIDNLIAATAIGHGLTLATWNTRYLYGLGVSLFDPWNPRQLQINQRRESVGPHRFTK